MVRGMRNIHAWISRKMMGRPGVWNTKSNTV
jgi:hypothetical protein